MPMSKNVFEWPSVSRRDATHVHVVGETLDALIRLHDVATQRMR